MTKKEQLYYLLLAFKRGKYDIPTFCEAYEGVFYPDVPRDELTPSELAVFEALGEVVARFSPYEDDLKTYPGAYHTAKEVETAIQKASSDLGKQSRIWEVDGRVEMSVREIIDQWDPVDLLSIAPGDEYHSEIEEVEELLRVTRDCEVIADGIFTIFLNAFGEDVFTKTKQDCIEIAKRILSD